MHVVTPTGTLAAALPLLELERNRDGDLKKAVPNIANIYAFLSEEGYGVHRPAADADVIDIYRQHGAAKVVQRVREFDLMRAVDSHLHATADDAYGLPGPAAVEWINKFGRYKVYNKANLVNLPELKLPDHRHGREWARFYYRNGFVELRAGQAPTFRPLMELEEPIRAELLLPRDVRLLTEAEMNPERGAPGWRGRCFYTFLECMSADLQDDGNATANIPKLTYLRQLLGFLLHDHRRKGDTDYCVILCDDEVGRTGKGLLIQALELLTAVCKLDCKNDRPDFSPLDLSTATRIKVYNDVKRTFDFTTLYNEITDGGSIRHMHRPPIAVPYGQTWKVLVTSNFVIRGDTDSDRGRQRVFDVTPFFRAENRVSDYFGHSFFQDWDAADWLVFDNIMLGCVKDWLDCGYWLAVYESDDYRERHLESEYPAPFRLYLDSLPAGEYGTADLYGAYMSRTDVREHPQLKLTTPIKFSHRMTAYLNARKRTVVKNAQRTRVTIGAAPPPKPPAGSVAPPASGAPPGAQLTLNAALRESLDKGRPPTAAEPF